LAEGEPMTNIFEQLWMLLIVAGVVFIGLAIFCDVLPPKRAWVFWLLPVAIAIAAFAIDFLVETDKEKIEAVLAKASRAVEKENIKAL
jgi:ABC-type multidrug transport system permease subunit